MNKINVLLYGSETECASAFDLIKKCELLLNYNYEHSLAETLEEVETAIVDKNPSLVVVLADGADGMEAVYRIKNRQPELAVFWFSNDKGFCIHSYRLDCAYFSVKPVTSGKIDKAIQRCLHIGIKFDAQ